MLQERSQNVEPKPESKPVKGTRRQFTNKYKEKVAAYANEHGVVEASKKFNIGSSSVSRWAGHSGKKRGLTVAYDEATKKKVLDYLRAGHNSMDAQAKFGIHNATISAWRAKAGFAPQSKKFPKGEIQTLRLAQNVHLLARKLKQAVRERLMAGVELEEVEIYASLLVKEILK